MLYYFKKIDKRESLMFRISAFFMATVLLFSMMSVSLAERHAVQSQAEADASADMSSISKTKWFILGGLGSAVG